MALNFSDDLPLNEPLSGNFPDDALPRPSRTWLEAFKRQLLRDDETEQELDAQELEAQDTEAQAIPAQIRFHRHVLTFEDVQAAAEGLRAGIPQIVSLADASDDMAQRLLDFLQGVIYAINGHQTDVSPTVFLFTPKEVAIIQSEPPSSPAGPEGASC